MGWAETPERIGGWGDAYSQPVFGDSGFLNLPPAHTFCNLTQDTCDPTIKPPLNSCQYTDSYCWWHGTSANWASNCAQSACSTEWLEYGASAPEPGVQRSYDLDCESSSDPTDPNHDTAHPTLVVGDLNDPTEYAERCGQLNDGGKFTLRLGSVGGGNGSPGNSGVAPQADYAQIDLHQLGAGFDGHIWFTHVYPPDYQDESPPENSNHKVVGTWTPNLDLTLGQSRNYDILVHLPSHGGNYNKAEYDVFTSGLTDTPTNAPGMQGPCVINQDDSDGNDIWEYIGNYNLSLGARVELSNVGTIFDDGTTDIAYDAVAFVPLLSGHSSICGHSH